MQCSNEDGSYMLQNTKSVLYSITVQMYSTPERRYTYRLVHQSILRTGRRKHSVQRNPYKDT